MSQFFLVVRLLTWGLLAACAAVIFFDGGDPGLFLALLDWAMIGFLVLGIRFRVRQSRCRCRERQQ
jgi:hypothetical protein